MLKDSSSHTVEHIIPSSNVTTKSQRSHYWKEGAGAGPDVTAPTQKGK